MACSETSQCIYWCVPSKLKAPKGEWALKPDGMERHIVYHGDCNIAALRSHYLEYYRNICIEHYPNICIEHYPNICMLLCCCNLSWNGSVSSGESNLCHQPTWEKLLVVTRSIHPCSIHFPQLVPVLLLEFKP